MYVYSMGMTAYFAAEYKPTKSEVNHVLWCMLHFAGFI